MLKFANKLNKKTYLKSGYISLIIKGVKNNMYTKNPIYSGQYVVKNKI